MSGKAIPVASKRIVDERDAGRCVRCGRFVGDWKSRHHRVSKGAGGSKREWINSPSNLITLCGSGTTGCHGWVTENTTRAREFGGWCLNRNGLDDPRTFPVLYLGRWVLLDDDGRIRDAPQVDGSAPDGRPRVTGHADSGRNDLSPFESEAS